MSTREFSWGKGGRCVRLTTDHPCSAESQDNLGALIYPEPLGTPWPVAGHLYLLLCLWRERLYRVSQEEYARLRESVPYVKLYRYNPKTYIQS